MRPLYIIGTKKDVGKTTLSLGLLGEFRKRGLRVGYMKPLGQRFREGEQNLLHDDARVVAGFLGNNGGDSVNMALPLPSGRVEQEIRNPHTHDLLAKIRGNCDKLGKKNDVIILEAMGHVAMGSCVHLSAADVAKGVGAKALLVSEGGIGKAIDEIALCGSFVDARGADLMGVVLNKVWPEKYDRVKSATTIALMDMGIKPYGAMPYQHELSSPTMEHIYSKLRGDILGGTDHFWHRVGHIIVAAMEPQHMIKFVKKQTLVITPGDRDDTIMVALSAHMLGGSDEWMAVSGLVLTGGYEPSDKTRTIIRESHLPTILVAEDTYTVANTLHNTVFKITPDDRERIGMAVSLVAKYVDVDGILGQLER